MKLLKKIAKLIGPGFITGASDDDPSGIATYAQTGAQFGYHQLWTAFLTTPFMVTIQEMCGRIGLVTGRGLAGVIREHYARPFLYGAVTLLVIANGVNIGADLGAMASVGQMLVGLPFAVWLIGLAILTLLLEIFVSYRTYAKYLKYLTLSLLTYVLVTFIVKQDWSQIFYSTIIPRIELSREYIFNLVAIFGTTISPYLFFWQASEEVEEEVAHHKLRTMGKGVPRITLGDVKQMDRDTVVGMIFSNLIMFFIIVTAASTLHLNGITNIETASQAAEALRPLAGNFAYILFALGVLGTGLLAIPILAGSASYAVAEAVGWREGLYRKFKQAHGFYGVMALATLFGILVNFTPIKPFQMLYYTAALNGILAPPLMIMILFIANNKKVMGQYTNTRTSNVMGWIITLVMGAGAITLICTL
jgi:NRAMP (natural resistance-associated macrophage protein)-like metal ion transporter